MSDVDAITQMDLAAIVLLAIANPIRSRQQQEALVRVCRQMDSDVVTWSTDAGATWEGTRCVCGRIIPVMADSCADCRRPAPGPWIVVCSDGVQRHAVPFATHAEALRWREWSHTCLSVHRIELVGGAA